MTRGGAQGGAAVPEASDLSRLAVPLVDQPLRVDAEDRRIGRLDELRQVVGDLAELGLTFVDGGDVLPHAHHAHDRARRVAARRRVQQQLHALAVLREQRQLVVVRLHAQQSVLQHLLHRLLEVGRDEVLHQAPPNDLVLRVAGNLHRLAIPLIDQPVGVDAEYGRVSRLDEHLHVGRDL